MAGFAGGQKTTIVLSDLTQVVDESAKAPLVSNDSAGVAASFEFFPRRQVEVIYDGAPVLQS
ncbi:hypothetical protein N9154_03930 [Akkermansiaceae bacterium]|nr:hypothetical protein [Akkermansiaceae bacterium]